MTPAQSGHLAMLAFSALVAGSFSLGSIAAPLVPPEAVTVMRFAIATVILGSVCAMRGELTRKNGQAPWRFGVLGALFATYFVLMFEGLKTAPAVSAAAVFTLMPVVTGVMSYLILRQVTTARMRLALAIGALGALWVIFRADLSALLQFQIGRGELIYFVGCVAHAIYIPMVRRLNRGENPLYSAFATSLGGAVVLVIWSGGALLALDWASLPAIVWVTILYVGIPATAITVVLLQYATLRLPGAKVMAYTYLTPSWVICWEIALGRGVPPTLVLGGIGLTIIAVLVLLKDEDTGGRHAELR